MIMIMSCNDDNDDDAMMAMMVIRSAESWQRADVIKHLALTVPHLPEQLLDGIIIVFIFTIIVFMFITMFIIIIFPSPLSWKPPPPAGAAPHLLFIFDNHQPCLHILHVTRGGKIIAHSTVCIYKICFNLRSLSTIGMFCLLFVISFAVAVALLGTASPSPLFQN